MGSHFKSIIFESTLYENFDQLYEKYYADLESSTSETSKVVLELGYKRALDDIIKELQKEQYTLFVDRDRVFTSESDIIPYDDDSKLVLTVHVKNPDEEYTDELTYADDVPAEVWIKNEKYIKDVNK